MKYICLATGNFKQLENVCISYSSVLRKYYGQGKLSNKEFILAYVSRGKIIDYDREAWKQPARMVVGPGS